MSADDEDFDWEKEEQKDRRFGRVLMFLFINGPTTLLTLGIWIRVGANTAQQGSGSSWLTMALVVWLGGLIVSALALFKK